MDNRFYNSQQQHFPSNGQYHQGGRARRGRVNANHQKAARQVRSPKEVVEIANATAFRRDFEAARSFDLEDDELFCPFHLLTEDDLQSIHSSGSDRSSLSSGSPNSSPLQHQLQPTPTFVLSASSNNTYTPSAYPSTSSQPKLHQPIARNRNAIPIINPNSRTASSTSPTPSYLSDRARW